MRTFLATALTITLAAILGACCAAPPGGFGLGLTPNTLTLNVNSSGNVTVNVSRDGGFTGAVTVTVTGLPQGVTADPLAITGSSGGLVLRAAAGATLGTSNSTVTGTSGSLSQQASLKLTVVSLISGSLDTGFGTNGKVITDIDHNYDQAYALAWQADGKIVTAGIARVGANTPTFSNEDFAAVRYLPDGRLDSSFDGDGKATVDFGGREEALAVAVQPDGKIVLAGSTWTVATKGDFALARYTSSGNLDSSFDGDGKLTSDFGGDDYAQAVLAQPDGKVVAAGYSDAHMVLARYNPNGSLDTGFGTTGKVTLSATAGWARAVVRQPDGKIVMAGYLGAADGDFGLARYNPDGSLDLTFDTDGWLTTDLGGNNDEATAIALQSDGKIVAAGSKLSGGTPTIRDFAVVRYHPDGSLDTTFDGDGKQTTSFADYDEARAVAVQPDCKIVVAGDSGPYPEDFAVARFNPDGSLDSSFDGDGKLTTDVTGGGNDLGNALLLQPDGKIVVAGFGNGDFGLARYWP